jgi:hypothetical protein
MKVLLGVGIGVLAVIVILVGVVGYLGFMPGVSDLFGSSKAKDLGVTFTAADLQSAKAKIGRIITDLPSTADAVNSIKFSGQKAINTVLTSAEATALFNDKQWKYYPLKNVQIKFNPDGTTEMAAKVIKSRIEGFAQAIGVAASDVKAITDYVKFIPNDPAVYVKGKLSVVNGKISQAVSSFTVGKLDLTKQIQDNAASVSSWFQNHILTIPGTTVKNLSVAAGKLSFEGSLPNVARSKQ